MEDCIERSGREEQGDGEMTGILFGALWRCFEAKNDSENQHKEGKFGIQSACAFPASLHVDVYKNRS